MKRIFIILFCIAFILPSCEKNLHQNEFDKSYKAWLDFKTKSDNSYQYVTTTSSWTGYKTETTITVSKGKIIGRNYKAWSFDKNTQQHTIAAEWTENADNVNTHDPKSMTLEEVYSKAKNEWLKMDPKENNIYFENNNNGMISSCGYVPKNCADDCFMGINIKSITDLKLISQPNK